MSLSVSDLRLSPQVASLSALPSPAPFPALTHVLLSYLDAVRSLCISGAQRRAQGLTTGGSSGPASGTMPPLNLSEKWRVQI